MAYATTHNTDSTLFCCRVFASLCVYMTGGLMRLSLGASTVLTTSGAGRFTYHTLTMV